MRVAPEFTLLGLNAQELTAIAMEAGQPAYRGRQLLEAVYRNRVETVNQITTLPAAFRSELAKNYVVGLPQVQKQFLSVDGTRRYLIGFVDGQSVETVWMPEGDDGEQGDGSEAGFKRATICVSSQAGCAVDCRFCMTALLGLLRNLSAGEIVGQILRVLQDRKISVESERINLVFMGQGEPFLNYDNFMKAVRLLVDGVGIPASRMTVSTAGIVPRIRDFGREAVRPKLAISLNAPNDELRDRVMPINRKWNLAALMKAAREFPLRPRERLTFEYVLLDGVNDSVDNAGEVATLIKGLNAKVNLIALNPGPEIPFSTPEEQRVQAFQQTLIRAGIPAFLRRPRGRDIYAACGQLKRAEVVQISA
ncbi:MAG: 23S rRNA (adenine(2503)-C(2))-methyltransferase RlmN [Terriglobales bacterium]